MSWSSVLRRAQTSQRRRKFDAPMTPMPCSLIVTPPRRDGGGKFVSPDACQNGVRLPSAEFERHPGRAATSPLTTPRHAPAPLRSKRSGAHALPLLGLLSLMAFAAVVSGPLRHSLQREPTDHRVPEHRLARRRCWCRHAVRSASSCRHR